MRTALDAVVVDGAVACLMIGVSAGNLDGVGFSKTVGLRIVDFVLNLGVDDFGVFDLISTESFIVGVLVLGVGIGIVALFIAGIVLAGLLLMLGVGFAGLSTPFLLSFGIIPKPIAISSSEVSSELVSLELSSTFPTPFPFSSLMIGFGFGSPQVDTL